MLEFAGKIGDIDSIGFLKVDEKNVGHLTKHFSNFPYFVVFVSSLKQPCCTITRAIKMKREIEKNIGNKIFYSTFATHALDENDYIVYCF